MTTPQPKRRLKKSAVNTAETPAKILKDAAAKEASAPIVKPVPVAEPSREEEQPSIDEPASNAPKKVKKRNRMERLESQQAIIQELQEFLKEYTDLTISEGMRLQETLKSSDSYSELKKTSLEAAKFISTFRKKFAPVVSNLHKLAKLNGTLTKNKAGRKSSAVETSYVPSDAFAQFAGWKSGQQYTRKQANAIIKEYVETNNLKTDNDKRYVVVDERLQNALGLPRDVERMMYFSLLSYVNKCLHKPAAVEASE